MGIGIEVYMIEVVVMLGMFLGYPLVATHMQQKHVLKMQNEASKEKILDSIFIESKNIESKNIEQIK